MTDQERQDVAQGRDWTVADRNYKHTRLYRMDMATGRNERTTITHTDLTVIDYDWSPDSQQLVIGAARTPTVDDSFMGVQLHIVPAAGGTPEPFVKTTGKLQSPRWSPDGRTIAWLGATSVDDPFAGTVFTAPVRGRAAGAPDRANLTPDHDGTVVGLAWQPGVDRHAGPSRRRTAGRAVLPHVRGVAREAGGHRGRPRARQCAELLGRRQQGRVRRALADRFRTRCLPATRLHPVVSRR